MGSCLACLGCAWHHGVCCDVAAGGEAFCLALRARRHSLARLDPAAFGMLPPLCACSACRVDAQQFSTRLSGGQLPPVVTLSSSPRSKRFNFLLRSDSVSSYQSAMQP